MKAPHSERASSVHETQAEAEQRAKEVVRNLGGGEVVIQGRDGKFRDADTVAPGNDPNPPQRPETLMATKITTRPRTKNHVGNSSSSKKEVHDLRLETPSCQIDELLKAGHGVTFEPDTRAQAKNEGYDNCAKCIGSSTR